MRIWRGGSDEVRLGTILRAGRVMGPVYFRALLHRQHCHWVEVMDGTNPLTSLLILIVYAVVWPFKTVAKLFKAK